MSGDPITYWPVLDKLDDGVATFVLLDCDLRLDLPREDWERLGRPGALRFTPEAGDPS